MTTIAKLVTYDVIPWKRTWVAVRYEEAPGLCELGPDVQRIARCRTLAGARAACRADARGLRARAVAAGESLRIVLAIDDPPDY